MVFKKYLVMLMLLIPSFIFSQTTPPTQVNDFATVQPTLVVVPFTTTGQDALNLYELVNLSTPIPCLIKSSGLKEKQPISDKSTST